MVVRLEIEVVITECLHCKGKMDISAYFNNGASKSFVA
ncbi:hypothetical protein BH20ACI2_BH20ACI2_18940 [soil metagenome]